MKPIAHMIGWWQEWGEPGQHSKEKASLWQDLVLKKQNSLGIF